MTLVLALEKDPSRFGLCLVVEWIGRSCGGAVRHRGRRKSRRPCSGQLSCCNIVLEFYDSAASMRSAAALSLVHWGVQPYDLSPFEGSPTASSGSTFAGLSLFHVADGPRPPAAPRPDTLSVGSWYIDMADDEL